MQNFKEIDDELDAEVIAMYSPETNKTDLDETSNTPVEETNKTDLDETSNTPVEETVTEELVPASRYRASVVAMNKAQSEVAELRKLKVEHEAYIQQLQAQKESNQAKNTDDYDDELKEAEESYSDIVTPILNRMRKLEDQLSTVSNDVGAVKDITQRVQQSEATTAAERHRADIAAAHPDAYIIADTPEYQEWYYEQAPLIQQALTSGTARDVVAALDLYKASKSREVVQPGRKVDKLALARDASTPNIRSNSRPEQKTTYTSAQIAKMSRQEFMRHEAAIDEALSRGEIF